MEIVEKGIQHFRLAGIRLIRSVRNRKTLTAVIAVTTIIVVVSGGLFEYVTHRASADYLSDQKDLNLVSHSLDLIACDPATGTGCTASVPTGIRINAGDDSNLTGGNFSSISFSGITAKSNQLLYAIAANTLKVCIDSSLAKNKTELANVIDITGLTNTIVNNDDGASYCDFTGDSVTVTADLSDGGTIPQVYTSDTTESEVTELIKAQGQYSVSIDLTDESRLSPKAFPYTNFVDLLLADGTNVDDSWLHDHFTVIHADRRILI